MKTAVLTHTNTKRGFKENTFFNKLDEARFGLTTIGMTFQSCLSAVAVNFLLQLEDDKNLIPLIVIAFITMASNAFMIAQASMKLIFNTFMISVISATAFLLYAYFSL